MANVVKIKRSTTTATPSTLAEGELAFSENSGNLFIGIAGGNIARIGGTSTSSNVIEDIQDVVGGMLTGNTQNGITVTYDDPNGKINFDVNDPTITLSGDATGSATMTNLGNVSITTTLSNSGVTAGTYNNSATAVTPITVDAKGRVTSAGTAVTVTPAWSSITSKPTTLSGYGITDSIALTTGATFTGKISAVAPSTSTASILLPNGSANPTTPVSGDVWANAGTINWYNGTATKSIAFLDSSITGNSGTATKLATSRTLAVSGDATGSASFDGSANATISTTLATVNSNVGSFGSSTSVPTVTVNGKGLVTAVSSTSIPTVSTSNSGLMSATDKTQHDALYTWYTNMTTTDVNSIIDTINEMLSAFNNAPESLNVYTELTTPSNMTLDGGTF